MILGILPRALPGGMGAARLAVAAIILGAAQASAATLKGVRHSTSAERTRVVLDLTAQASYSHRVLSDPPRVVVDLPETGLDPGLRLRSIHDGFVTQVRLNELRSGRIQVVIDMEHLLDYAIFTLDKPDRIVVDVKHPPDAPSRPAKPASEPLAEKQPDRQDRQPPEKKPEKKPPESKPEARQETKGSAKDGPGTAPAKKPAPPVRAETAAPPAQKTPTPDATRQNRTRVELEPPGKPDRSRPPAPIEVSTAPREEWVVALDAGHGGEDHGARYHDTSEKDITLALAKELKNELEKKPGIKVILVRKGDYFIPLRRRWTLAEKQGANLFVSLHCNASKNKKAEGTEVYFLSLKGATDEAAQELAHRENAVDRKMGVNVPEDDLNEIIFDMMQTNILTHSEMLAETSLNHLFDLGTVYGRGVKQAGFAVLKSPRMPSILVEAAFLSNRKENKMLRDGSWRREFSARLADGIDAYIKSVDPAMKAER